MKYTIYQITNKLNGKIYIGKHQTENIDDGYFGSGVALKEAIKKYGKEFFEKEILFVFNTEQEMNAKERELITEDFVKRKDTYNLGVGGEGGPHFKGKTHSKETINKIKKNVDYAKKASILSEKYKRGELTVWNKGKQQTEEHNRKIRESKKGTKHSDETINKIKAARAKQIFSDETRRKMSESAKRRKNNTSGPVD